MKVNPKSCNFYTSILNIALIIFLLSLNINSVNADERVNNLNYFAIGARAMGLNSAYTAMSNDYTAQFWNPATMDFFTTVKIGGMHSNMSLNRQVNYLSFIFPTKKYGAFALAWAGFGVTDIETRASNTLEPDGHFNYNENTIFLSYAYRILPILSIGCNFKLFNYQTLDAVAKGIGMDFAILLIPSNKFRFGVMAQDLGAHLNWSSGIIEKFFETYRFGFSFDPISNISVSCDFHQTKNSKAGFSLATEMVTLNLLKFRCGFSEQKIAGGMGVTVLVKGVYLNINYAIASDQLNQGISNVFDLSVVF
jgi:hypothetical protein